MAVVAIAKAQWPTPATAQAAYDTLQAKREEAGKLWAAKDPKGVALLNESLAWMDQPLVADLAAGNRFLAARRTNILLDLAEAYALKGNIAESLKTLHKVALLAPDPDLAKFLESNQTFSAPEFKPAIAEFRRFETLWDSPELGGTYRPTLSDAEKIAGLSKFWSEVKYNFAYPEKLIDLHWDQLYLDTIPKVLAARTTADYYRQLSLLCAKLSDGHTNVYSPDEIDDSAKPPVRTLKIGDKVMIVEVRSPSLEQQGIKSGMEIVKVDGESPIAYARREVEPCVSASTPQDRELRTFSYGFLRDASTKPVLLTLRSPDGAEKEVVLARTGYKDVKAIPPFAWRMLPGNVALVALNSFETQAIVNRVVAAFPKIREASAVILDIRANGGGDSGIGYSVLRRFIDKPVKTSRQTMRRYNPTDRARGSLMEWQQLAADEITPAEEPRFTGPVVVLTSAATFSAAEDFLVAWQNSGRGKTIGEASGGSTGQPLFVTLPGGGKARVCTKRDTFPDGREFVGIGILPDIEVHPTVPDIIAGKDTVLERALQVIQVP